MANEFAVFPTRVGVYRFPKAGSERLMAYGLNRLENVLPEADQKPELLAPVVAECLGIEHAPAV